MVNCASAAATSAGPVATAIRATIAGARPPGSPVSFGSRRASATSPAAEATTPAESSEPIVKAQAKALKCSCAVDATGFVNVSVREGTQRVTLNINIGGRVFTASINAKSLRKAVATIKELGPDNVIATVQGVLVGDVIEGAGLAAMPKGPKPAATGEA